MKVEIGSGNSMALEQMILAGEIDIAYFGRVPRRIHRLNI